MTATPDIYARVHFSDGEALDTADLEKIGQFAQMLALDRLVGAATPSAMLTNKTPETAVDPHSLPFLLVAHPGQAALVQGSANNKIKITKGTVFQAIANTDGETPAILAYTFPGTNEVTIANAAGATPRVDLIQIALSQVDDTAIERNFEDATTRALSSTDTVKRHRTACEITVKQGTPAASPTVPTLDAGCVAIATVLVGASYAAAAGFKTEDTAGAVAVIHDQRMPIGVRAPTILKGSDGLYDPAKWTFDQVDQSLVCTTPNGLVFECAEGDTAGRLIGVSLTSEEVSGGAEAVLIRVQLDASGRDVLELNNPGVTGSVGGAGVIIRRLSSRVQIDCNPAPALGPTVIASAENIGVPVWSNGQRAWVDPYVHDSTFTTLGLRFPSAGTHVDEKIHRVQFWIAGS